MYGRWSDCSLTCGGGIQHRTAVCVDSEAKTLDDGKCFAIASETTQKCEIEECPKWQTGDWTEVTNISHKCIKIFLFKTINCVEFYLFFTPSSIFSVMLPVEVEYAKGHTGVRLRERQ